MHQLKIVKVWKVQEHIIKRLGLGLGKSLITDVIFVELLRPYSLTLISFHQTPGISGSRSEEGARLKHDEAGADVTHRHQDPAPLSRPWLSLLAWLRSPETQRD